MTQKILTRDFVLAFFAQFAFLSVFYLLYSYSPNLSFEIGIYEDRDWCSHWNLLFLLIGFKAFCCKRPFKGSRKNIYDCWCPPVSLTSVGYLLLSLFGPF